MDENSSDNRGMELQRHVVLVAPEIHWNTGNIGRTCLAAGACLHLVKPLGFSLASREVKRAGLDYWQQVNLTLWDNFEAFLQAMSPGQDEVALFSKTGTRPFWDLPAAERLFLIFGSETGGLPQSILKRFPGTTYYIPITDRVRSLNLSTAAAIALYESLRTARPFHGWQPR